MKPILTTPIETERLILRNFKAEDADDLYDYLKNPEVVKYEPYEPYTREACTQEAINRSQNPNFIAICLKSTGQVIGNLYFAPDGEEDWLTYELGYVFNLRYQKQGYATEAATALLNHAFSSMGVRRVIIMCNPENSNSWHLAERLHMRRESHLVQNIYFNKDADGNPIWQDTYQYALLAHEWPSKK